jgi:hypothetical protein
MSKMSLEVKDKVIFFCFVLFIVSIIVVAFFEQKVAISLLIVSSGILILIGFLQGLRISRSENPSSQKVISNKGQLFISATGKNDERNDISIFPWWWQLGDALSDCCESLITLEIGRCFDC